MSTDFNNKNENKEEYASSFSDMARRYTEYDAEPADNASKEKLSEKITQAESQRDIPVSRVSSAGGAGEVVIKQKEKGFKGFLKGFLPWKGDDAPEIIRKMILIVAIIILIICLPIVGKRAYQKLQFSSEQKELSGLIDLSEETQDKWDEIKAQYPDVIFPEGLQFKFAKLYALNQDMVGWLKIEGTSIDFPIVQGKDNDEYLYLNFHKKNTNFGNPFLDYRNDIVNLSKNTIIHGHHMRDNTIFAQLENFKTIEGFKNSPIIEFDTLFQDYKFKVYAAYLTNSKLEDDNGYAFNCYYTTFPSEAKFEQFIAQIDQRKFYSTGVDIQASDKIITLSTCDFTFDDARLIVIGRLVRDGEDASVDTSLATEKPENEIRYPQAYYDKIKKENPFKDAAKWDM